MKNKMFAFIMQKISPIAHVVTKLRWFEILKKKFHYYVQKFNSTNCQ